MSKLKKGGSPELRRLGGHRQMAPTKVIGYYN